MTNTIRTVGTIRTFGTIRCIGIAGSGTMGTGIAEVAATSGFEVLLRSRSQEAADVGRRRLEAAFARRAAKGSLSAEEAEACCRRVRPVSSLDDLALCDLVVESVVEDLDVKRDVFRELDRVCGPATILTSNTSTLPVTELAMTTGRPPLVCGLHFFNPAPRMPVVEVIPAETTSGETVSAVEQFARDCGKTAVVVKDRAGFVVNALLFPYLNGAVALLEAGVATMEDIDTAMRGGCGFPMGPLELLDLVGLDIALAILDRLHADGVTPAPPSPRLRELVAAGRLGRKAGSGFYDYDDDGDHHAAPPRR